MPAKPISTTPLNKATIEFGYGSKIVLPLENATSIMGLLKDAESIDSSDYSNPKLVPYKNDISLQIISEYAYKEMKLQEMVEPSTKE